MKTDRYGDIAILTPTYLIKDHLPGSLSISARPRGDDWLQDELKGWQQSGINLIASTLCCDEVAELGLSNESAAAESFGMKFSSHPIPDRGTPGNIDTYLKFIKELRLQIDSGCSVLIHCRMGIGRSSLTAASILLTYQFQPSKAFEMISIARGLTVPDTSTQVKWLEANRKNIADAVL